jgi:dihydrofolate synthase/folylpolyglutamate synthase
MEVLSRDPLVVADGAHNDYSVGVLLESLPKYFDYQRLVLIVGFSRDKQVAEMVDILARVDATVIATGSRHPRSLSPEQILAHFRNRNVEAVATSSSREALAIASDQVGPNDLVLVTGSLFVAAEAREALLGIEPEVYPDLIPAHQSQP